LTGLKDHYKEVRIPKEETAVMGTEKRYCSICAWRGTCQKRFSVKTDSFGMVYCPDFSRDLSIRSDEAEELIRKEREERG